MGDQQHNDGHVERPQSARLFNPNEHLMQVRHFGAY